MFLCQLYLHSTIFISHFLISLAFCLEWHTEKMFARDSVPHPAAAKTKPRVLQTKKKYRCCYLYDDDDDKWFYKMSRCRSVLVLLLLLPLPPTHSAKISPLSSNTDTLMITRWGTTTTAAYCVSGWSKVAAKKLQNLLCDCWIKSSQHQCHWTVCSILCGM